MNPKVSILIPVYNVSKFIERCARSLFDQTFESIEYIFVNDCTPDESIEILSRIIDLYPNRKDCAKIIHHKTNKGLGAARNTGLTHAHGDYILNVDSDDFIELDMVELMYNKAQEENSDIVVCDYFWEWSNTRIISPQAYNSNAIEYTKMLLNGKISPCVWNKMIKKSLYTENNIYSIENIDFGEDYVITPRLSYFSNKISKVEKPLYHYIRINENAYTKNFSIRSIESIKLALNFLSIFFENNSERGDFKYSLLQGQLRKKIMLLMNTESKYHKDISKLFPDSNSAILSTDLNISEKITIYLTNRKKFICLRIFLYTFHKTVLLVQIINGIKFKLIPISK